MRGAWVAVVAAAEEEDEDDEHNDEHEQLQESAVLLLPLPDALCVALLGSAESKEEEEHDIPCGEAHRRLSCCGFDAQQKK